MELGKHLQDADQEETVEPPAVEPPVVPKPSQDLPASVPAGFDVLNFQDMSCMRSAYNMPVFGLTCAILLSSGAGLPGPQRAVFKGPVCGK